MTTIAAPKNQREDVANSFRLEMAALGCRWNCSYFYWMVPAGLESAALEIRSRYPDTAPTVAPNQFCLDRRGRSK